MKSTKYVSWTAHENIRAYWALIAIDAISSISMSRQIYAYVVWFVSNFLLSFPLSPVYRIWDEIMKVHFIFLSTESWLFILVSNFDIAVSNLTCQVHQLKQSFVARSGEMLVNRNSESDCWSGHTSWGKNSKTCKNLVGFCSIRQVLVYTHAREKLVFIPRKQFTHKQ